MKFDIIQTPGGALKITGALDVYAAEALREAILGQLGSASTLVLDLSDVASCDVVGLQLLCSARKTAEAAGKSFALAAASPALLEGCIAVGLPLNALPVKPSA